MSERLPRFGLFIDFDGTITQTDICDALFSKYGNYDELVPLLREGKINVSEFYRQALSGLSSECSPEVVREFALTFQPDPYLGRLVAWAQAMDAMVMIVSDGFDAYIEPILSLAADLPPIPIKCNRMTYTEGRWQPGFPGAAESCDCFCASCKRNIILAALPPGTPIIYVGDGLSDLCPVQYADVVFSKGSLSAFCRKEGIPYHHFDKLFDVYHILGSVYADGRIRIRRRAELLRNAAYIAE